MPESRLTYLVARYHSGEMSGAEWKEFHVLFARADIESLIEEELRNIHNNPADHPELAAIYENTWWLAVHSAIHTRTVRTAHRIHFLKTAWFRVAVAVLIILTGFLIYNVYNTSKSAKEIAIKPSLQPDILPGSNKAILTLSDGSKIQLNNTASETIADGDLAIKNNNGQLIYGSLPIPSMGGVAPGGANSNINPSGPGAGVGRGATLFNTMATPRGGQYQLTLPDGTRVWLNAASSITYPTAFNGNIREVSITGEAYLEIKPDKQKPFIVNTKDQKIEVLGTAFNINAYEDEKSKISLISGAIKINNKVLKPGQALMDENIQSTNIYQDIAWKNGAFNFENTNLSTALKQLSRWYDVDIVFENNIPGKMIAGEMGRDLSLMQVLRILKRMGINTRLEKRNLIILSE